MDEMISKKTVNNIIDSWAEYYREILEHTHAEGPTVKRLKAILYTLNRISEEIEEA